jgi:hypothetical protein
LRLRGRGETAVWGHLVFTSAEGSEQLQEFHFDLQTNQITLKKPEGDQTLQLDEMGVVTVDG